MENNSININIVAKIAGALKHLKKEVVFVGGAVISLYTDDPAADEIRPTMDVDVALNIASLKDWTPLQEELIALGFYPNPAGHALCNYLYQGIPVDIMMAHTTALGPANRWYPIGFEQLWTAKAKEEEINIFSPPCYLATKFEAFNDRARDFRTSHDMEDIIYILDNRSTIVEEVEAGDNRIRNFLINELQEMRSKGILEEALLAHMSPDMTGKRLAIVKERITSICKP
ncbi:MAG: hypothetical protein KF862_20930 [Chitinophagaceae bacterium]|nr:hypothetical protein [Chitinophagaceae bacterium]